MGNPRGIEHAEREEQEIAEGCNRLIENSIICWNYLNLTKELEAAKTEEEKHKILNMAVLHSPLAWWFVNMFGEYDLTGNKLRDNHWRSIPRIRDQDHTHKMEFSKR